MKSTIKYKFLKLMKGKGTLKRKEVCLLIFKAQGKKGKEAKTYRPGYYSANLKEYIRDGLLEQPNGKGYRLTKLGVQYVNNPDLIHYKIRLKREKDKNESLWNRFKRIEQQNTKFKSVLRDIRNKADFPLTY